MDKKTVLASFISIFLVSALFGTIWSGGFETSESFRIWYVDDDGEDIPNADFIGPRGIQLALAYKDVVGGHEIKVAPGRYMIKPEDIDARGIWIDKAVTLIGMNRKSTIIWGLEASKVSQGMGMINIVTPGVTLSNFTIFHAYKNIGIKVNSNRVRIRNNNITNHAATAILIQVPGGAERIEIVGNKMSVNQHSVDVICQCSHSTFSDNTIEGNWSPTSTEESKGINIVRSIGNTIRNNTIKNCSMGIKTGFFSENNSITENNLTWCDSAMSINSAPHAGGDFIEDNEISNCSMGMICENLNKATFQKNKLRYLSQGMHLSNSTNCTIGQLAPALANTLEHVSNDGILLSQATNCTIQGNTLEHVSNDGILLSSNSSECIIQGNILEHVSKDCVHLSNTSHCKIKNNFIYDGNQSGISLINSDFSTILENRIHQCSYYGVHVYAGCDNYVIYHNDFLDNGFLADGKQALDETKTNPWDNGTQGNYWSDYKGEDKNGDGIGETLSPHYEDRYPLVVPRNPLLVIWKDRTCACNVTLGKHMTLSSFYFSLPTIGFDVTFASTDGYCNVSIPKQLLEGAFKVYVDNEPTPAIVSWNQSCFSIYIDSTYFAVSLHSIKNIRIEGEASYIGECPDCDLNNDGEVDIFDVVVLVQKFAEKP